MADDKTSGGVISFVGAGPGAPDLLTLRARDRLQRAEVVVWASSLVPEEILGFCPPAVELHDSASMTLEEILEVYETNPHRRIVRLHSGDPALYGAIAEQIRWCRTRGRRFEIVPGVSSLGAAAAAAGCELTVPGISQSVVCTRLPGRTSSSMGARESVSGFAEIGATMAVFLSASRPDELQRQLLTDRSAYTETTPVVVAVEVSRERERLARCTLGSLSETMRDLGARKTVLVLVGDALGAEAGGLGRSNLYDPGFAHSHRRRSTVPRRRSERP